MAYLLNRKCRGCGEWSLVSITQERCSACRTPYGPIVLGMDTGSKSEDPFMPNPPKPVKGQLRYEEPKLGAGATGKPA